MVKFYNFNYTCWGPTSIPFSPPFFTTSTFLKDRTEKIFNRFSFTEKTDKYLVSVKGKDWNISGADKLLLDGEGNELKQNINLLEVRVSIFDAKGDLICLGEMNTYNGGEIEPFFNYLFEIDGKLAKTEEEKDLCIEKHIEKFKSGLEVYKRWFLPIKGHRLDTLY